MPLTTDDQLRSILMSLAHKTASMLLPAACALALVGMTLGAAPIAAGPPDDPETSRAELGLLIAPVPLNMTGKNRALVGLGSYIVNAEADCNGCHTRSPQEEYVYGGIPFFGQSPTVVNPAVYLGGGQDFGTLDRNGLTAHIVSRNLTPDKAGRPEGGHTYEEFKQIMRTGVDMDHVHPTCEPNLSDTSNCVPAPFDGRLLQIMPWPAFRNMTEHDLRAIYEYLSAVPCVAGPPTGSLHNDCS
jgi:hypothetical protein